jgi:hypothetical protein
MPSTSSTVIGNVFDFIVAPALPKYRPKSQLTTACPKTQVLAHKVSRLPIKYGKASDTKIADEMILRTGA